MAQEGDLKLTQSGAILRYLARKSNLLGETEMECARADMMADVAGDYRDSLVRLCYNPKFDQKMLQQWVSGTGDFKGSPLKTRLENLEK